MDELFNFILISSFIVILAIFASNFFLKLGVPTLLIGLVMGVILSNFTNIGIPQITADSTLIIGEIALCIIIFAGGFESNVDRLKHSFKKGIALSTFGVAITTFTAGLFFYLIFDFSLLFSFLLAAVIASTDAAAVFSIIDLKKNFSRDVDLVIQVESGSNDPMAYFLVIALVSLIKTPEIQFIALFGILFVNIIVALITAFFVTRFLRFLFRLFPPKSGQSSIIIFAAVFLLYSINALYGGSYFLAVYIFGLFFNMDDLHNINSNQNFFESISWLMETILFIILGYQIFLPQLSQSIWIGIIVTLIVTFIARPIGVLLSLFPFREFNRKELTFISWVGLRGATPIVFGLIPLVEDIENASLLFNIAFVVVLISLIIQGTTTNKTAELLDII